MCTTIPGTESFELNAVKTANAKIEAVLTDEQLKKFCIDFCERKGLEPYEPIYLLDGSILYNHQWELYTFMIKDLFYIMNIFQGL